MSKVFAFFLLLSLSHLSLADDSNMTDTAKTARDMQSRLYQKIQVPFTLNYNRNLGQNNNITQGSYEIEPTIPLLIYDDYHIIIEPMLTLNSNTQNSKVTNQEVPIQLASYIGKKNNQFSYGFGPYIQLPATNSNNGSLQTGLGGSYGLYWKNGHYNIGGTGYFSFGVGSNLNGGTANVFYANPTITYTSDNAYTYSFQSAINSNFINGTTISTNQLTLTAAKTYKILNHPLQFSIGPTYMITTTPTSPKGWGGVLGVSFAIPEKY